MLLPSDAVSRFVAEAARRPDVGLWNPVVSFPDGSIDFAGVRRGWLPGRSPHLRRRPSGEPFEISRGYGGVLFASRALFERIGGWDERFFLYFEDVDLSWRARAAGFAAACVPAIEVIHESGYDPLRLPPRIVYYHTRNWLLLLDKHGRLSGPRRLWIVPILTCSIVGRLRHLHDLEGWRAALLGIRDFFSRRTGRGRFPCENLRLWV